MVRKPREGEWVHAEGNNVAEVARALEISEQTYCGLAQPVRGMKRTTSRTWPRYSFRRAWELLYMEGWLVLRPIMTLDTEELALRSGSE